MHEPGLIKRLLQAPTKEAISILEQLNSPRLEPLGASAVAHLAALGMTQQSPLISSWICTQLDSRPIMLTTQEKLELFGLTVMVQGSIGNSEAIRPNFIQRLEQRLRSPYLTLLDEGLTTSPNDFFGISLGERGIQSLFNLLVNGSPQTKRVLKMLAGLSPTKPYGPVLRHTFCAVYDWCSANLERDSETTRPPILGEHQHCLMDLEGEDTTSSKQTLPKLIATLENLLTKAYWGPADKKQYESTCGELIKGLKNQFLTLTNTDAESLVTWCLFEGMQRDAAIDLLRRIVTTPARYTIKAAIQAIAGDEDYDPVRRTALLKIIDKTG